MIEHYFAYLASVALPLMMWATAFGASTVAFWDDTRDEAKRSILMVSVTANVIGLACIAVALIALAN